MATRRAPAFLVVLVAQGIGLALAVGFALVTAAPLPPPEGLAWAFAGGTFGILALVAFYQGLAIGRMGIVAPVAGVLGASIPVIVGSLTQGLPSLLTSIGIVLAVASVALVSQPGDQPPAASDRRALALALLAGAGFGLFFVCMHQAGDGSPAWLVSGSRGASVVAIIVALVVLRPRAPAGDRRWIGIALLAGIFDVAGNGLFVAAVQTGALAIAAVTSSLYPITTVVLARVILGERFAHVHVIGIAAATAAVVCIAAG